MDKLQFSSPEERNLALSHNVHHGLKEYEECWFALQAILHNLAKTSAQVLWLQGIWKQDEGNLRSSKQVFQTSSFSCKVRESHGIIE